ncbi:MAG: hypothetical protein IPM14_11410 [bacterium]|nr:hypothetical protein [bacterium]
MAKEKAEKTCFVIMPVTTPKDKLEQYKNDRDHFKHVLDCLFIPAIEKAGFQAIRPIATGSELIHSRTITQLEKADLVLCDLSIYNPNVFFELGIRTSMNKRVCLVKDNFIKKIPFDIGPINCEDYSSALDAWLLPTEIEKLSLHIQSSYESSENNTLWEKLGIASVAQSIKPSTGLEGQVEYLSLQMASLAAKIDDRFDQQRKFNIVDKMNQKDLSNNRGFISELESILINNKISPFTIKSTNKGEFKIIIKEEPSGGLLDSLTLLSYDHGISIIVSSPSGDYVLNTNAWK